MASSEYKFQYIILKNIGNISINIAIKYYKGFFSVSKFLTIFRYSENLGKKLAWLFILFWNARKYHSVLW